MSVEDITPEIEQQLYKSELYRNILSLIDSDRMTAHKIDLLSKVALQVYKLETGTTTSRSVRFLNW